MDPKTIYLGRAKYAIVDSEDYTYLKMFRWYYDKKGIAVRHILPHNEYRFKTYERIDRAVICMHREVMKAPEGKCVKHINGNKLDNRKENLRICK